MAPHTKKYLRPVFYNSKFNWQSAAQDVRSFSFKAPVTEMVYEYVLAPHTPLSVSSAEISRVDYLLAMSELTVP